MRVPLNITVRSTELDAYGHVNNAKYLEYLEWGRFEWFRVTGLPLDAFGHGVGAVVANVNVNYRREATLGEELRVDTRLVHLGGSSFRFAQEVFGVKDDSLRADALVTGVAYDVKARRPAPISGEVRGRLERLVVP